MIVSNFFSILVQGCNRQAEMGPPQDDDDSLHFPAVDRPMADTSLEIKAINFLGTDTD